MTVVAVTWWKQFNWKPLNVRGILLLWIKRTEAWTKKAAVGADIQSLCSFQRQCFRSLVILLLIAKKCCREKKSQLSEYNVGGQTSKTGPSTPKSDCHPGCPPLETLGDSVSFPLPASREDFVLCLWPFCGSFYLRSREGQPSLFPTVSSPKWLSASLVTPNAASDYLGSDQGKARYQPPFHPQPQFHREVA